MYILVFYKNGTQLSLRVRGLYFRQCLFVVLLVCLYVILFQTCQWLLWGLRQIVTNFIYNSSEISPRLLNGQCTSHKKSALYSWQVYRKSSEKLEDAWEILRKLVLNLWWRKQPGIRLGLKADLDLSVLHQYPHPHNDMGQTYICQFFQKTSLNSKLYVNNRYN